MEQMLEYLKFLFSIVWRLMSGPKLRPAASRARLTWPRSCSMAFAASLTQPIEQTGKYLHTPDSLSRVAI
jgi:hypothetical protein